MLSNLAAVRGDKEHSAQLLKQALELDPNNFQALLGLANLALIDGDADQAIDLCKRAMKVRPDLGSPHFHLGRCFLNALRYEEAAASLERALSFDPNMAPIHHHLGLAYQQLGRGQDAAKEFQKAISLDPKNPGSHAELGNLLLAVGNLEGAIASYRRAAALAPGSARSALYLGKALVEERKFSEAEISLRRALELEPGLREARVLLGRMLQQLGKFSEAERVLEQETNTEQGSSDALYVKITGKTVTEADRPIVQEMQARADSGKLGHGEQRMLHYALGKAYDDLAEYERAMANYDLANKLSQERLNATGRRFNAAAVRAQVDATIAKFGPKFVQESEGLGVQSDRPVFIVGMPRSGTTLLEQIVSSHPEVSAAGELGGWPAMTNGPFQTAKTVPGIKEVQAIASEFLERLERASEPARFTTEKSPQNYMVLGPILAAFPNAHILHCRRNALDTCLSIYTTSFMSGPDFAHDRMALVTAYREYSRLMEHWRKVLPADRLLEIDYEGLVEDRETVIRRILEFLGLPWDEACMYHERNEHAISTPSLWQARQPVFNRSVGRWRNYERWLGPLSELHK